MRRAGDDTPPDRDGWWRNATFYQVYVRSFADSDGDGVGDLDGIRDRLGYLELLGVDALWLTPFLRSPMADHSYDVADPRDVDPLFGDLDAFDRLVAAAHGHGIKVTIDLVPTHTHPQVHEDLAHTLRFWLDRGVDGFRIDVVHGVATAPDVRSASSATPADLPDMDLGAGNRIGQHDSLAPRFDDDGVRDIHRLVRRVLDEYPGTMAVGEIWAADTERLARYLRQDELHLGFNFRLMPAPFDAAELRKAIELSLETAAAAAVPPTWTLSNHDVVREVTRYGDGVAGEQRARAMALVELGLPGVVYLYNGAELGLPNVELPDWAIQDPTVLDDRSASSAKNFRSGGAVRGRDGCRVPLPWEGADPPFGFSPGTTPWLPIPQEWAKLTVERQLEDASSTLSLYRHAIELRKTHAAFTGDALEWYGAPDGCFAYRRKGGGLICVLNASTAPVPLPAGEILLSSGPLADRHLPSDTAAWLV